MPQRLAIEKNISFVIGKSIEVDPSRNGIKKVN